MTAAGVFCVCVCDYIGPPPHHLASSSGPILTFKKNAKPMTFLLYPQVQFVLITNNSYANMLN